MRNACRLLSFLGSSERPGVAPLTGGSGVSVRGCPSRGAPVDRLLRRAQYAARREPVCRSFFSNVKRASRPSLGTAYASSIALFASRYRAFVALPSRVWRERERERERAAKNRIRGSRCVRNVIGAGDLSRVNRSRKCDSRTRGNYSMMIRARGAARRDAAWPAEEGEEEGKKINSTDASFFLASRLATWRQRNFHARAL